VFLIIFQTPRSTINSGCLVANTKCYWCARENGSSCIREFRSCDYSEKWTGWISSQKRLADVCVICLNPTSLRQGLGQFLRERFRRGRILACDELSIYDDVSLQLYNPCQSTVSEDINMNTHLPIFGLLIDASQFLDLVLQKEGNRLIVVIIVRNHFECENVERHNTLTPPAVSSSVLEKPVTFLPAKIDFPFFRAPTRALDKTDQ